MKSNILEKEKERLEKYTAERVLEWAVDRFSSGVVFASSMGVEDQILLDMISRLNLDIPVFTLDTGRLFNESYELITESEKRYGVKIQVYTPDGVALESMVNSYGVNLFYDGEEERRRCCSVRKIEPLQRALKPHSAWICGLRKDQSVTRKGLHVVDWDSVNSMEKINPL
jgi:phosphoadenosine phosphosulfate reductase